MSLARNDGERLNSYLNIMNAILSAERPLSRGDILSLSGSDKNWKSISIHTLLNSLFSKGCICESGHTKCGKTIGRLYEAAILRDEYYVQYFYSTGTHPSFVKLMQKYIEKYGLYDTEKAALSDLLHSEV